jgi:hypothetical protein
MLWGSMDTPPLVSPEVLASLPAEVLALIKWQARQIQLLTARVPTAAFSNPRPPQLATPERKWQDLSALCQGFRPRPPCGISRGRSLSAFLTGSVLRRETLFGTNCADHSVFLLFSKRMLGPHLRGANAIPFFHNKDAVSSRPNSLRPERVSSAFDGAWSRSMEISKETSSFSSGDEAKRVSTFV